MCLHAKKCQKTNTAAFTKVTTTLNPLPITSVWHHVEIDLLTMPQSYSDNKYILVAMDTFSKWPECVPLKNKTAQTVADALLKM